MLQLKNTTPFAATMFLFPNREAVDTLYVVVKATFDLHPKLTLADEQRPVAVSDEYWGEPGQSSLKYPNEAHLEKPGTDVIVVAEACAPNDKPVTHLDIAASVAGVEKRARVIGDRIWEKDHKLFRPSAPRAFTRMPLTYEHAFGGTVLADGDDTTALCEARNPVGLGFNDETSDGLLGTPLPNIEDPRSPLRAPTDKPAPVGFGAVAASWQPRVQYAGTYDDAWRKTRAPYLPQDFDPRFFNAAPERWTFPRGLQGGEPVLAAGMSPQRLVRFELPRWSLSTSVRIAGAAQTPVLTLETVILEPTDAKLTMTWRAAVPCDKKTLKVEQITISGTITPR